MFSLQWTSTYMAWLLDGVQYHRAPCGSIFTSNSFGKPLGPCAPFDIPFYIIINVAIGGGWPGPPSDNSIFPQTMLIDYVRVYSL